MDFLGKCLYSVEEIQVEGLNAQTMSLLYHYKQVVTVQEVTS